MSEVDEQFRQMMRDFAERRKALVAEQHANCPHLQGGSPLSVKHGELTSIVWHQFNLGYVIGICTNCLREFWPADADYTLWLQKPNGNLMSKAGVEAAVTPDQEAEIRANGYGNQPDQDWNYDDIYLEQIKRAGVDVVGKVLDTLQKRER